MSQNIKVIKSIGIVLLIVLSLGVLDHLNATHIVGADMRFECNGKEWFTIELTVRRDCFNGDVEADFDDPAFVGIYDAFGTPINYLGSLGLVKMDLLSIEDIPVDPDGCGLNTDNLCVTEARYEGKVFLPFRKKGYVLGYQRCCRNVTLTNIVSPLETGNTSFVCITEESQNSCNNSPDLGEWPEVVICAGQPMAFDASATDPDGDSLAYMLYTPHTGGSLQDPQPIPPIGPQYDEVEYATGFSLDNVLGSGTPLTIDSKTGVIYAVPGAVGQYLVGILVQEFRNGIEISKTRRNFEYNVVLCDNAGSISFDAPEVLCEGTSVTFTNTSADLSGGFQWNFNFPSQDQTYMSTEVSPTFDFQAPGSYIVQLLSTTSTDPCDNETFLKIDIFDSQLSSSFEVGELVCESNGDLNIVLTSTAVEPDPEYSIVSTTYDITVAGETFSFEGANITATVPCASSITISQTVTSSNTCTSSTGDILFDDIDTSAVSDLTIEFFADTILLCFGESVRLVSNPNPNWTYTWTPTDGLDLTNPSDPLALPASTTTYSVEVTNGEDVVMGEVTVKVIDSDLTSSFEVGELVCTSDGNLSIDLTSTAEEPDPESSIVSTTYVVTVDGQTFPFEGADITATVPCASSITISQTVVSSNGCTIGTGDILFDDIDTSAISELTIEFFADTILLCFGESVRLVSNPNPNWTYTWTPTDGLDLTVPSDPLALPASTTTYSVEVTNGEDVVMGEVTVKVIDSDLTSSFEVGELVCTSDGNLSIDLTSTAEEPDPESSIVSTTYVVTVDGQTFPFEGADITATVPCASSITISQTVVSSNGCTIGTGDILFDDIDTSAISELTIEFFADTILLCFGESVRLVSNPNPNWTYTWTPTDGLDLTVPSDPLALPASTTTYSVEVTNGEDVVMGEVTVKVIDSDLTSSFEVGELVCTSDGNLSIDLTSTAEEPDPESSIVSTTYVVTVDGQTFPFEGAEITATVPCASSITISQTVVSSNGCTIGTGDILFDDIDTSAISELTIEFFADTILLCFGESVRLVSNPNPNWTYTWTPTDGLDLTVPSDPLALPASTTTYSVEVTNGEDIVMGEVTVKVIDSDLTSSFEVGELVCTSDGNLSIDLTSTAEEPDPESSIVSTTYVVTVDGQTFPFEGADITATVPCASSITISQTVVSSNGCTIGTGDILFDDIDTSAVSDLTIEFFADTILLCFGESVRLVSNPNPNWTYTWTPTDGLDLTNPSDPLALPASTTTYSVEVTNGEDVVMGEVTVKVIDSDLTSSFEVGELVCTSDGNLSIDLTSTAEEPDPESSIVSTTYVVTVDGQAFPFEGADITATVPCASSITISQTIVSSNGCTIGTDDILFDDIDTSAISELTIEFFADTILLCFGESVRLVSNPNPNWTYTWTPTDGLDLTNPSDPLALPASTTTYSVEVTNGEDVVMGEVTVKVIDSDLTSSFEVGELVCTSDGNLSIDLTSTAEEPDPESSIVSTTYIVTVDGQTFPFEGADITATVPCASSITISQTVVSSNGCTIGTGDILFDDIDTSAISELTIEFFADTILLCFGESVRLVSNPNPNWTYTWTPTDGLDLTNPSDPLALPASTTTYSVEVTNGEDVVMGEVTVKVIDSDLTSSFEVGELVCTSDGNLSIDLTSTAEEPDPESSIVSTTYIVTVDGQAFPFEGADITATVPCASSITISQTVVSSNGCTIGTGDILFDDIDTSAISELSIEFFADTISICSGDSVRLVSNPNPNWTYTWTPTDGLDLTVPSDPLASPDMTTTYMVEVSNGIETAEGEVTVIVITELLDVAINGDTEVCGPNSDFSATANNADDSDVTFEWSLDPSFSTILGIGPNINATIGDTSGTIYLRGSGAGFVCGSNVASLPFTVIGTTSGISAEYNPIDECLPTTNLVTVSTSAPDQEITVVWSPSDNIITDLNSPSVEIVSLTGQFEISITYTATTDDGCVKTETLVIPVIPELDISIINNSEDCPEVANLTAVADNAGENSIEFEWSFDQDFSTVVATGSIVEIPISGESATIYARGSGSLFCGSNIPVVTVDRIATGISAAFDPINTCVSNEGTVTIVNSIEDEDFTVVWEQSDNITSDLNSAMIDVVAMEGQTEINLTYTATNSEGCSKTETITIPVTDEFTVSIGGGAGVCVIGPYTASSNIGNEFVDYEWSLEEDFATIFSTDDSVVVDLPDGTPLFLRGTSIGGCISNVATTTIQSEGSVDFDAPRRICIGDTADVELLLPVEENLMVTWDPAAEIISGLNDAVVIIVGMPSSNTSVVLNYTVTDGGDCTIMGTIEIPYSTVIPPAPDPQVNCGTHEISFNIDSIYEDGDILWDFGMINGEVVTSDLVNPTIDFGMPGVFSSMLTSTMETCNFDPTEVFFEVPIILEITSDQDPDQRVCEGDSLVTLGAMGNGSILVWTDQDGELLGTGDSLIVDSRETTSATATITDAFGCSASLTFETGPYMFDITIEGPGTDGATICGTDPVTLMVSDNAGEDLSYLWTSTNGGVISGGDTASPTIDPANADDLILVVTNNTLGCTEEFAVPIIGIEINASIDADPGTDINLGQTVDLIVNTDGANPTFMWDDGTTGGMRTVTPTESTTYTVTVTDENGCTVVASIAINVNVSCTVDDLFIPSAFSPNGDDTNDILFVRMNAAQSVDFQILNRWGTEVFRSLDQSVGWRGRHKQDGNELAPDVYAYCVTVVCPDGSEIHKVGHVALIR